MSIPSAQKKLSHQQPCSIRIHGFPAGFLTNSIRCLATRPGTKKPFANLKMAEMVDLPMKKKGEFPQFLLCLPEVPGRVFRTGSSLGVDGHDGYLA